MPIYEQDPKELLGEDIQQIAAPDDSNFYMETPSLLSAVNPFTSDQRVQRSRQAAFRIDNTLGSFIASAPFSQFDRVEGYNPFDNDAADIKGYEDFADSFINSGSPEETMAIKHRIDQQRADMEYNSGLGFAGTVSSVAMRLADPFNAIYVYSVRRCCSWRSYCRNSRAFCPANAAGSVASEAALQATQEARSPMESVSNVVVDALVGGILGAGAQLLAGLARARQWLTQ